MKITSYSVGSTRLPEAFDGLKIVQISVFHNIHSRLLNRSIRKAVKKACPDIIALTGDLIDRRRPDIESAKALMEDICSVAPIYYVTGNHESLSSEYPKLKQILSEYNVHILENDMDRLQRGAQQITIAGVNDPIRTEERQVEDDVIRDALEKLRIDPSEFSILLSHRPEQIAVYASENIDVVLCGHAHGGQIRIPFVGGLLSPNQGFFPKLTEGVITESDTHMVISRGIGNSVFPFRINNRPEVVIVTLQKK